MVELFRRPLRATNHGLCSLRVICVTARNGPKPLWTHHITGPIERSRLAMTTNKKFPICGYMRGSLPATLGGVCRSGCWRRGVYFSVRFELPQKSQNRTVHGVADRATQTIVDKLVFKVALSTLILNHSPHVSSSKKMMVPPPHPPTPPNKAGNLLLMTHGRQTNQWWTQQTF